jgi:hypothetical protein
MKVVQLFLLIFAFLMISPSQAGLLIEPAVGFNVANFQTDSAGYSEEKAAGLSWGGRLGYQNFGFQLGLDYLSSKLSVADDDYKDLSMNEIAGFVGFEFPVLLRVYAGYILSATGETELSNQKVEFSEGSGMKVGVGFTGLPFVDINFEYRRGTFDKTEVGGSDINSASDYNAFMIGASLPFVL